MKKLLAVILAVTMLMSMAVVASAENTFATPVELGLYVGGWGADKTVSVAGPGTYTLSWEGSAKSYDWLIVKNTAGENEPTSIPEGTVISITELKIDDTAYTFDGGKATFDFTVGSEGKIEIKPYLTPNFGGADHIDSNPMNAAKVEVTFSVVAPVVPEEPEEPAFDPILTVFESETGDTMSGTDAYIDPWGSFAEGPFWGSDHDAFPGASIDDIKEYAKMGGVKFSIQFTCNGFATWSGNNGPIARFNAWDEGSYDVPFSVQTDSDGKYIGTVKLDDVVAKYVSATGDETLDGIYNFTVQLWSNEFKLYKAWFEMPAPAVDTEVTHEDVYKALENSVGTLDGVSGDLQLKSISTVNTGESIVLHFIGTSDGDFRYWISQGAWVSRSDITTVTDREFDVLVEIVATGDGADSVQFKGPGGGALNNLTLTHIGVFYGTMDEYDEAYAAKKAELEAAANSSKKDGRFGAYVIMGDEYHAQIGQGIIITTEHVFDENNTCLYCGHHVEPAEDEIIVEVTDPVEPSTDEEEDVTVDVEEPAEEPAVEENPKTGLALAVVPMLVAALAVVITKR
ncbi:MAG: hypothetical protein IJ424_01320 [Oscillospiraceae bacterium]|nr:hypothetical protein [Oscillospiraceae bacterium]